jgi:hypothetical protein
LDTFESETIKVVPSLFQKQVERFESGNENWASQKKDKLFCPLFVAISNPTAIKVPSEEKEQETRNGMGWVGREVGRVVGLREGVCEGVCVGALVKEDGNRVGSIEAVSDGVAEGGYVGSIVEERVGGLGGEQDGERDVTVDDGVAEGDPVGARVGERDGMRVGLDVRMLDGTEDGNKLG